MVAFPQIRLKTEQNFPKSDETLITKSDENHKIDENKMKLVEGKLRSHLPWLWFALAFHKLAPGVAFLIAHGGQALQGRRPWAVRAPSQRHWTIARPPAG